MTAETTLSDMEAEPAIAPKPVVRRTYGRAKPAAPESDSTRAPDSSMPHVHAPMLAASSSATSQATPVASSSESDTDTDADAPAPAAAAAYKSEWRAALDAVDAASDDDDARAHVTSFAPRRASPRSGHEARARPLSANVASSSLSTLPASSPPPTAPPASAVPLAASLSFKSTPRSPSASPSPSPHKAKAKAAHRRLPLDSDGETSSADRSLADAAPPALSSPPASDHEHTMERTKSAAPAPAKKKGKGKQRADVPPLSMQPFSEPTPCLSRSSSSSAVPTARSAGAELWEKVAGKTKVCSCRSTDPSGKADEHARRPPKRPSGRRPRRQRGCAPSGPSPASSDQNKIPRRLLLGSSPN
jgi:hypothetical protein